MRRSTRVPCLTLSFLLLLSGGWTATALDSHRDLSRFSHEVWLTENGLPQNTVHSVAQTKDGYIWIGTEEGLARFDGVRFTIFDTHNTPPLKSNYIRTLLADRDGVLWIGTAEGLVRKSNVGFTTFTTNEGLPSNTIQSVYQDREGTVWIATATGLCLFKDGALTPFTTTR
jgi:ligand-binding sensor domain-containing protein